MLDSVLAGIPGNSPADVVNHRPAATTPAPPVVPAPAAPTSLATKVAARGGEGLPFPTVRLVPSTYCVQITGGPAASAAAGREARCGQCTERPEALGKKGIECSEERSKTQADGGDGPVSGVGGAAGAQQAGVVCGSCIHSGAAVGHWRGAQHSTPAASMATTW